jgi:hypothetical protein
MTVAKLYGGCIYGSGGSLWLVYMIVMELYGVKTLESARACSLRLSLPRQDTRFLAPPCISANI